MVLINNINRPPEVQTDTKRRRIRKDGDSTFSETMEGVIGVDAVELSHEREERQQHQTADQNKKNEANTDADSSPRPSPPIGGLDIKA